MQILPVHHFDNCASAFYFSRDKHERQVVAANGDGKSALMIALEGGGGADGAAFAMELINISGCFASGQLNLCS